MNTIVKICGLMVPGAIDAAIAAGADMVGFIFFDKSPRHLSLDQAASLGAQVGSRAAKVLLTVDADDASLAAAIAALDPAFLQLHGSETPERVAAIRASFGVKVIKAIGVGERADLDEIRRYDDVADILLFDARPQPDASRPGGAGVRFDWSLLAGVATKKPWLLAGGLNAENVAQALRQTGAPGVDISSGVESSLGVKDKGKIAEFVAVVRAVRAEKFGLARATV
jgi:phosphoribosylanthranilate isomerase